jgi:hypothetical protein
MANIDTFIEDCELILAKSLGIKVELGWPVGTLVCNKHNGRRGVIRMSDGSHCSIEFSDGIRNIWVTTWDVVLGNYSPI